MEATEELLKGGCDLRFISPDARRHFERSVPKSLCVDHELNVHQLTDAVVLPGCPKGGGVVSADGEYFESSFVHRGHGQSGAYSAEVVDEVSDPVIYIGLFNLCWGHCLTDGLKFIWALFSNKLPEDDRKHARVVYTMLYPRATLPKNFLALLQRLGIEENRLLRVDRPTRFAKLYLPDESFWFDKGVGRFYTKEYADLLNRISLREVKLTGEKIYLTRSAWKGRVADYGESRIANYFRDRGYRIVSPENLSLEESIDILGGCSTLAATEGSIAHNAVFLRPGSNLVLLRKADWFNDYQLAIDSAKKLLVTYVDANRTILMDGTAPWNGPFFLYVTKYLVSFGGGRAHFPVGEYVRYVFTVLHMKVHGRLRGLKAWIRVRIGRAV